MSDFEKHCMSDRFMKPAGVSKDNCAGLEESEPLIRSLDIHHNKNNSNSIERNTGDVDMEGYALLKKMRFTPVSELDQEDASSLEPVPPENEINKGVKTIIHELGLNIERHLEESHKKKNIPGFGDYRSQITEKANNSLARSEFYKSQKTFGSLNFQQGKNEPKEHLFGSVKEKHVKEKGKVHISISTTSILALLGVEEKQTLSVDPLALVSKSSRKKARRQAKAQQLAREAQEAARRAVEVESERKLEQGSLTSVNALQKEPSQDDESCRGSNPTVVKNYTVVIVPTDYPSSALSKAESDEVLSLLSAKIDSIPLGSMRADRLLRQRYSCGSCSIEAADKFTETWLINEVNNLRLKSGSKLRVIDSFRLIRAGAFFPGRNLTSELILKRLCKQNSYINSNSWSIVGVTHQENTSFGIFCIPESSFPALQANDMHVFYLLWRVRLELFRGSQ